MLSRSRNPKLSGFTLAAIAGAALGAPPMALAQAPSAPSLTNASKGAPDDLTLLSPKPFAERTLKDTPTRNYHGLPLMGWMLYPSFSAGPVYDDNAFQQTSNRVGVVGARVRPTFVAERNAGIHRSSIYANADLRLYPQLSTANTVNAQAGVSHVWDAGRDLTFRGNAEYTRRTDVYNNGLVISPFSGSTGRQASPQRSNQMYGYGSALKSFNGFFVGLAGSITANTYDTLFTSTGPVSQSYHNGLAYTATGRLGYLITPLIYGFTEATGNFRTFNSALYNSEGYRVTAGLGTDRISLFRGEIYGGYQRQFYDFFLFRSPSTPVFGGTLFWYPTRAWTISLSLDETFQESGVATVGNATGSGARVTSPRINVNYALARDWTAAVYGSYDDVSYIFGTRHDQRWSGGAQLNYEITRNLNATFEYTFIKVFSNASLASFARNQFTLGATYRY